MSLMSRGRAFVADKQKIAGKISVAYVRSASSIPLDVWLGQTGFASNIQNAARLERSEVDVLFEANDLVLNGVRITPLKGDRIVIELNGTAITLELMIPQTGEPSWRYSDAERTIIRAHCKRVI